MVLSYKPINFDRHNIPEHMRGGIERYVRAGIRPGDFLLAVFRDEFSEAVLRADFANERLLREYALFLHSGIIPDQAWGSRAKVDDWIKRGGELGADKEG